MRVIRNLPASEKYETIKAHLLHVYGLTKEEWASKLLNLPGLGDMKPTQLWNHVLDLHPDDATLNFLARAIFLQQLPEDMRAHLKDKRNLSNNELVMEADQFFSTDGRRVNAFRRARDSAAEPQSTLCFYHS